MDVNINFPTRTIEALIQQNKTLSAKLNSISKLCDTQGLEIRELKKQNDSFYKESQKKAEENQVLLDSYQKIQISYQKLQSSNQSLQASHKQIKDNLVDAEKQFATQYTDFLEKQQALEGQNSELKFYICRLARYKNRIHLRVKPYLKNLKYKITQNEQEKLQQREKISTFQKQLTHAYNHIKKISSDLRNKEKAFQVEIEHVTQQLSQEEATNEHNKNLHERLLEAKNKNAQLKADLVSIDQRKSHLEKDYREQIEKLQKQIEILIAEKEDLFHQLKVFSKELIKKEIKQSQVNTLWQKKLTVQMEGLQNSLKVENSKGIKERKNNEFVKTNFLNQDKSSKIHQIYQTLLEVQTGVFKTLS